MKKIAEQYIKYGLSVLPVKLDKSPSVKSWKEGVDDLGSFDNAEGVGIICGKLSDNLEVLDFDNHFGDAKQTISKFINIPEIKEIYDKYKLPIESTQSGGFHLLFRCDKIEGNQKLASKPKWNEKRKSFVPDAIIETRGEGGYIVAAPTKGYEIIRGDFKNISYIENEERDIIIETAKSFNEWFQYREDANETKDKPGDIYNDKLESIEEMKSSLMRAGWIEIREGYWRREGKNKGISATVGKVAPNVFYCFTSNGYPFVENSGYKPFQVVGLLDYNGDFKTFAKDLSERYDLNKKPDYNKKSEAKETKKDYESLLNNSYIDLEVKPPKPPIILEIANCRGVYHEWQRLFTAGNFSAITGKAKSKKTFSTVMPLAALVGNGIVYNKFRASLPESKRWVLRFDTEQGNYDAYISAKRVENLLGDTFTNYGNFGLRELDPLERCEVINYAIEKYKDNISFILIDGVADLTTSINSEDEAIRVGTLLLKWTKKYNIHICTIIHQNKGDNFATGHLGSYILKKAEVIISVEKDKDSPERSMVNCEMIRGSRDFDSFGFFINDNGMPEIYENIGEVKDQNLPPWQKD